MSRLLNEALELPTDARGSCQLAPAEADARAALKILRDAQGGIPHSNRTGIAWLMLGKILASDGKEAAAREAFQSAVTHLSDTVDADHPKLIEARQLLSQYGTVRTE